MTVGLVLVPIHKTSPEFTRAVALSILDSLADAPAVCIDLQCLQDFDDEPLPLQRVLDTIAAIGPYDASVQLVDAAVLGQFTVRASAPDELKGRPDAVDALLQFVEALVQQDVAAVCCLPWWPVVDVEPTSFEAALGSSFLRPVGLSSLMQLASPLAREVSDEVARLGGDAARFILHGPPPDHGGPLPAYLESSARAIVLDDASDQEVARHDSDIAQLLGLRLPESSRAGAPRFEDLAQPFAESVMAKSALLRAGLLSNRQRARVLESISDDIKKLCDVLVPAHRRPRISEAAAEAARQRGVDLSAMAWHDQPRFDPGRATFHLEHVIPVSTLRTQCLEADSTAGILEVLREQVQLAWILKSEDAELTRLGFRRSRPDPHAAYEAAGIVLHDGRNLPDD